MEWTQVGMSAEQSLSTSRLKQKLTLIWVTLVATKALHKTKQAPNESWAGMITSRASRRRMIQKRSVTSPMHREEHVRIINLSLRIS